MSQSAYQELWIYGPYQQSLCALINGDVGWLMYLREPGDAGFSSRNPNYNGPEDAFIDYVLSNGQRDQYPASWALPLSIVMRAIEQFQSSGLPPDFIVWHNESGDGFLPGPMA
jgi:hypothetical protein